MAVPTESRCYWWRPTPDEGEHFIPACMGGAVDGPDGCTCDAPRSQIETAEAALAEAHELIGELRSRLTAQAHQISRMMARNADLRRMVAQMKAMTTPSRAPACGGHSAGAPRPADGGTLE